MDIKLLIKTGIAIILVFTQTGCGSSKKVPEGFSMRSEKSIQNLCKAIGVQSAKPRYVYCMRLAAENEEVYLRNLSEEKRNSIERNLMDRYKEVILLKRTPQWYYVVDNSDNVGIYNLDGSLFCPPLPGKIRLITAGWNHMIIGDSLNDDEFQNQYAEYYNVGSGLPAGSCLAIVNWKKGEYIIPYGEYVDIAFTRKGGNNHYYVAKYNAEGSLKWGICNQKGKIEVPCEYESVGLDGGKYLSGIIVGGKLIGRNDISMYEFTSNNRERYARARANAIAVASVLMSVGETMVNVAAVMPGGNVPATNANKTSSSSNVSSNTNAGQLSLSETTSFNADRDTYNKCVNLLINMSSNNAYSYSDTVRKDTQRQMKQIREKWAKRGQTINQSSWETWNGN